MSTYVHLYFIQVLVIVLQFTNHAKQLFLWYFPLFHFPEYLEKSTSMLLPFSGR
jgi:hypothetical protein